MLYPAREIIDSMHPPAIEIAGCNGGCGFWSARSFAG